MKRFKRTVAYVLAAVLSFSSFLQPVPVFAAEESAKVMEISGEQKTEETKGFNVSVTEGKGSIEVRDEEGNISKAAPEEPLSLDCPAGSFFEITAIPEYGYQAAFYKTMTDTGEVKEEILTPALENGHYTARINVDEISSIEIGFSEISPEESGDLEVQEIPEETPAEDPEKTLTEEPEDVTAVPDIADLNASDFASMRLVVLADDASVIVDDSDIIGRYENVYLLQFSSIQQTVNAYAYYKDKVTAVEPDAVVETASEDNGPKDIASISMDSEMNPIEVLNDVETSDEVLDAHGMIALIDTGVSEGEHVMARVSVIDDKLEGNGHGNDMLEAIISQDAEGKILSIRAMDDKGIGTISSLVAGMEYAIKQKVDIINLSVYAKATLATSVLKQEIQKAAAAGILVVGAAGNDSADAAGYMPGSVDEAYIIGAAKEDGTRLDMSNFGETVDYNVVADSTSEAAALFTGFVSANGLEAVKDILNQGLVFAADYTSEPVTEEPAEDGQEYVGVSAEEAAMYEAGLIPTVEPNLVKTYTAEQLKEDLPEDTFTVAAGDTTVSEYGSNSLADVAGVNRESIMNWLGGHVSTDYYLSTPYNPGWIENSGMSADYRNPNGDCQGAYGAGDTEGQAGMNCTGFVWHALTKAGGTEIPALSGWVSFIRNNNIRYRTYTGSDITDIINTILYEDDWIEPGDIIWMWDAAAGKMNNGLSYGISNYHHVGIYVGAAFDNSDPYNASPGWFHKDNGDINGFWHSTDHGIPDSYAPGNMISNILPKTTCMAITVVKTDTAEAKGGIAITKSSAKPEMTDGNSAYSLAGAEYGVYKQGTEEQVATLVTDVNGYGKVEDIPAGNYDIRELKAPAGYALDTATGTVTVTGGQTVAYSCQDTPQSNPVAVLLRKVEADKNKTQTQASASLANAEFTVKYYKGIYDTDPALQGIDPERTWIMKTNEKGDLPFDEKAKISGDDLYYMTNGNPALPLGTVTIQETKAPAGFLLNQEIFIRQITSDGTAETVATYDQPTVPETSQKGIIRLQKSDSERNTAQGQASLAGAIYEIRNSSNEVVSTIITDNTGKGESERLPLGAYTVKEKTASPGYQVDPQIYTVELTAEDASAEVFYKSVSSKEDIIRGGVTVEKWDSELDKKNAQGTATLEGTQIQIISQNDQEILADGKVYKKGEVITTLTTDKEGKAGTSADFLPYGSYQLKEVKQPGGYTSAGIITRNFEIRENRKIIQMNTSDTVIKNEVIRGGVAVEKWDSELNKRAAQGEATLEGAKIQIISRNEQTVLVGEKEYKKGEVVATLTTDKEGKASTSADLLPYGDYQLKESIPPVGYTSGGTITRNFQIREDGKIIRMNTTGTAIKNEVIRGGVAVEKWDSEKDKREPQGTAALEGTKIQIISQNTNAVLVDDKEYKQGEVIITLTTDKDGKASTVADLLPYGNYQLKETVPPTGYTSGGTITRNFEIREDGKIVRMNTSDTAVKNEVIRGGVAVEKWDSELEQRVSQGDAGLEGTRIQIISNNPYTVLVGEKEYKKDEAVATLTTDKDGKAGTSADFLPYGDYQLKETLPPTGYTSGGTITRNFEIREDGKIVQMNTSDTAVKNEVIRGGVTIAKWSLETNERKTQGGAALDGAKFTVTNCSAKAVLVDGQLYQPGEVIATVETGEDGLWTSEKDWLPYGTYEVAEVQEPDGYLPDGAQARNFQIREDGKIVSLDNNEGAIKNQVKRGDLNFVKVADSTLERLENVPFKITSKTTGESHIVVSDRNGQVDTSSAWNLHSQNTNRGETSEDGVWFSGTTEKEVPVNDEKGALPYDTYRIEEQRCEANEGYKLLSIEITVYRDNYTIPLGTLTDDSDLAEIATTAIDSDTEDHYAAAGENTTITDTVEYTNLNKGEEYTLKGILMNKATGEPVTDGEENPVTAEKTFTAKKVKGTAEMTFTFDSTKLAGADIVVFEELYQKENLIAEHTDITDEEQTIHFPEIGTKAMDQETNTNVSKADREITLVDTVSYSNLQPGKKYKLTGTLMDKETGEPVKDAQGKEITAETSFKPETSDGTVNVTFAFDGSNLAGKTLVVFESLERNDTVYAVHTDINDQAQTIYFPGIGTTAKEAVSGTKFGKADKITLVDTVSYSNLTPGTEYILKGILMDKETGESVKVGGQEVTAETTFKPEEASGAADVTFAFDASSLAGHTLVVFEELFQTEASIAEHKDITDEGQTIYIPRIGTTALDKETGNHNSNPDEKVTIVDTVTYKGLIPGKEYTVKGTLMDKSTGKELQADGKTVIAEKTFTAEKAEGSVELTFTFDGRALAGRTVVAFEHVYYKDKEVGIHTDIEDEDQSIHFPAIGTTAKDTSTEDHIANAGKVTILDTVSYKNLIPGRKYTLKGVLMDKATGKELLIDEKKVTAEKEFTPKTADGSVDLEYTFDASALAGKQVVVYEELYTSDKLIGEHKDINDEGQTVTFPWLRTNASDGVTGKHVGTVSEKATVIDVVSYKGLLPGKEYTIKGTLMNKETGEPVKNSEGKDITAEKTFTPENEEGSVELVYELDSTLLAGQTAVVFEDLLYNGVEVGSHGDIQDEGQSVRYPDLGTQAKDKNTGLQEGIRKEQSVIADTVAYQNLIPGQEYTLKGILMNKSTGTPLLINKKEIAAEKTFIPETTDGTVVLEFSFDSTVLKNPEIVVFESLFVKDKEVNAHRDLNDKGQTVKYPEHKIQTQARDKESETQEARAKADTMILDTVTYEGLIPGQSYTLKGMLMDKSTGEPLLINEKQITAEKTFIPEKSSGREELEFTFDASIAAGKEIVVFERLYVQEIEVASHTDLEDENQTVKIKVPEEPKTEKKETPGSPEKEQETAKTSGTASVKTGDEAPIGELICILTFSGVVIAVIMKKKRSKKR